MADSSDVLPPGPRHKPVAGVRFSSCSSRVTEITVLVISVG